MLLALLFGCPSPDPGAKAPGVAAVETDVTDLEAQIATLTQALEETQAQVTALEKGNDYDAVLARLDTVEEDVEDLDDALNDPGGVLERLDAAEVGVSENFGSLATQAGAIDAVEVVASANQSAISALDARIGLVEQANVDLGLLGGAFEIVEDTAEGAYDVTLIGNLRVENGLGSTAGGTNGYGNVIIGYDENDGFDDKSGSHNLIVGAGHSYDATVYGSALIGEDADATAPLTFDAGLDLDGRLTTVEGYDAGNRLDTLEAADLDNRIAAIEGQSLASRVESLEMVGSDTRLAALEATVDAPTTGLVDRMIAAEGRLDGHDAVNADGRLSALEDVNSESRLTTLENVDADTRLGTLETTAADQYIDVDVTRTIPGDHADLTDAFAWLSDKHIASGVHVTFEVDGTTTYSQPLTFDHRDGDRVHIIGDDPLTDVLHFNAGTDGLVLTNGTVLGEMSGLAIRGDGVDVGPGGATGLRVDYGAVLWANDIRVEQFGGDGVVAAYGAVLSIEDSVIDDHGDEGLTAVYGPTVGAARSDFTNNADQGAVVAAATLDLSSGYAANNQSNGVYANAGAALYAPGLESDNNGLGGAGAGVQVDTSHAYLHNLSAADNPSSNLSVNIGAAADAFGSIIANSQYGVAASIGAVVNARSTTYNGITNRAVYAYRDAHIRADSSSGSITGTAFYAHDLAVVQADGSTLSGGCFPACSGGNTGTVIGP